MKIQRLDDEVFRDPESPTHQLSYIAGDSVRICRTCRVRMIKKGGRLFRIIPGSEYWSYNSRHRPIESCEIEQILSVIDP